ncbi:MAG: hypothetical protein ACOCWA_04370, partial [Bacteroidota bacterium]
RGCLKSLLHNETNYKLKAISLLPHPNPRSGRGKKDCDILKFINFNKEGDLSFDTMLIEA